MTSCGLPQGILFLEQNSRLPVIYNAVRKTGRDKMRINNILTAIFLVLFDGGARVSADRDMKGTQSEERDAFFARVKTADNLADKNIRAVRDSGQGRSYLMYFSL